MWVNLSYLRDTAQWPLATRNLLTSPSAAFSTLDFMASFRLRDLVVLFFLNPSWITKQEEEICSSSCLGSALQTFVPHSVPRDCPMPTPATRRVMFFPLFLLAQIHPGQKFQTDSERYLTLWIGFKYFSYLPDDTSAVSVWFSELYMLMMNAVFDWNHQRTQELADCPLWCVLWSVSAWTATKTDF